MSGFLSVNQVAKARLYFRNRLTVDQVMDRILSDEEWYCVYMVRALRKRHEFIPFSWPDYERELEQIANPPHSSGSMRELALRLKATKRAAQA